MTRPGHEERDVNRLQIRDFMYHRGSKTVFLPGFLFSMSDERFMMAVKSALSFLYIHFPGCSRVGSALSR